jgi:hypothetical protein
MKSIANAVDNIIDQSPLLRELLSLNIINLSALAREIQSAVEQTTKKDVTEGSIVMALKRLNKKNTNVKQIGPKVFNTKPELIVRSNLFEITVQNSPTLIENQQKLLSFAQRQQSYFTTFTYGLHETTTIASNQIKEMALSLYKREQILSEVGDVAIITINFPIDIVDSPFVYYTVLRTLAWAGISVTEIVSTYTELTIVLKHSYVELAFSLIKKLFSPGQGLSL